MASKNETNITAEPGKQDILITREFEAPRELVFKAFTDRDLIVQWLRPCELTMRIEKFDPRAGGSYRYIHSDEKGNEYAFNGVIHDVAEPERIIQTFEFEGLPERGHVSMETTTFMALPGNRTKVITHSVFQSVADRDGMMSSGMSHGVNDAHRQLDELFAKGI